MRRISTLKPTLLVGLLVLAAGGCSTTVSENGYNADLERLSADCTARGGILVPNGQNSARPQADHDCRITGVTSRIDQQAPRN